MRENELSRLTLAFGVFHIALMIIAPDIIKTSMMPIWAHKIIIILMGLLTMIWYYHPVEFPFQKRVIGWFLIALYLSSAVGEIMVSMTWNIPVFGDSYLLHLWFAAFDVLAAAGVVE